MKVSIRQQLQKASQIVGGGGVIAYPTESCFGLGCYPKDSKAVKKILQLKQRPMNKCLILIGSNFEQLKPFMKQLPDHQIEKMLKSWPAAITWLVPASSWVPEWLTGASSKIAIRIPDHKLARDLCRSCGHALVSTSANKSGQQACRTTFQVKRIFSCDIDYVVDATCGSATKPSKIFDLESGQAIR